MVIFIFIVWLCAVYLMCQSRRRWLVNLGGVLGVAGALVCLNAMLHII